MLAIQKNHGIHYEIRLEVGGHFGGTLVKKKCVLFMGPFIHLVLWKHYG